VRTGRARRRLRQHRLITGPAAAPGAVKGGAAGAQREPLTASGEEAISRHVPNAGLNFTDRLFGTYPLSDRVSAFTAYACASCCTRRHATTVCLCTSIPAQHQLLLWLRRRREAPCSCTLSSLLSGASPDATIHGPHRASGPTPKRPVCTERIPTFPAAWPLLLAFIPSRCAPRMKTPKERVLKEKASAPAFCDYWRRSMASSRG
jgi:hypothetical protein